MASLSFSPYPISAPVPVPVVGHASGPLEEVTLTILAPGAKGRMWERISKGATRLTNWSLSAIVDMFNMWIDGRNQLNLEDLMQCNEAVLANGLLKAWHDNYHYPDTEDWEVITRTDYLHMIHALQMVLEGRMTDKTNYRAKVHPQKDKYTAPLEKKKIDEKSDEVYKAIWNFFVYMLTKFETMGTELFEAKDYQIYGGENELVDIERLKSWGIALDALHGGPGLLEIIETKNSGGSGSSGSISTSDSYSSSTSHSVGHTSGGVGSSSVGSSSTSMSHTSSGSIGSGSIAITGVGYIPSILSSSASLVSSIVSSTTSSIGESVGTVEYYDLYASSVQPDEGGMDETVDGAVDEEEYDEEEQIQGDVDQSYSSASSEYPSSSFLRDFDHGMVFAHLYQ